MVVVHAVVGTFGSGKTTSLLDRVRAACTSPQTAAAAATAAAAVAAADTRVLVVAPTRAHCTDIRRRLGVLARSSCIVVATPAQLLAPDDRLVLPYDLVCIDDIDAPEMQRLADRLNDYSGGCGGTRVEIIVSARTLPGLANVACAENLFVSHRTAANGSTWFLRRLFAHTASIAAPPPAHEAVQLVPCAAGRAVDMAAAVWSVLMQSTVTAPIAVMCNTQAVLDAVAALAPDMNRVRLAQSLWPITVASTAPSAAAEATTVDVQLTSVQKFRGRECATAVLVLSDGDTRIDLVEGVTRHTRHLAVIFDAAAPPQCLCDAAASLADLVPAGTYINWAPRKPHITVRQLAARATPATPATPATVAAACAELARLGVAGLDAASAVTLAQICGGCGGSGGSGGDTPMDTVDARLLGTAVEALFALCVGMPPHTTDFFKAHVHHGTRIAAAVAGGGWWPDDDEALMWSMLRAPSGGSDSAAEPAAPASFFGRITQRIRLMVRAYRQHRGTQPDDSLQIECQVPAVLHLADGTRVSGVADFVARSAPAAAGAAAAAVFEVKYVKTLTQEAYTQMLLYMHALHIPNGYLFNVRTSEVFYISMSTTM